jgi:hypothetical protein
MRANRHRPGNMAVLVNAPRPGLRNFDDALEVASMPQLNRESGRGQRQSSLRPMRSDGSVAALAGQRRGIAWQWC